MKNVIIIDALNMFLKNYVVSPHLNKKGLPIGGTIGFLKSLQAETSRFNPDEIIVAWDGHEGSQRRKSMNSEYKNGRSPVRFNRRMIELSSDQEQVNRGEQQIRLMEYLNEMPVIQLVADFTEADDIIALVINHSRYKGWKKTIISSDKDFFQLCRDDVQVYRPSQNKLVTQKDIIEEFGIHPNNFALARAIEGDKSDNLPGVPGAGLKTIATRFPYLIREDEYSADDIIRDCAMQSKKLKIHENIQKNEKLIKDNYQIMQLQYPNIRPMNRTIVNNSIDNFDPRFDKIKVTQMLFDDDASSINFTNLHQVFRKIKR